MPAKKFTKHFGYVRPPTHTDTKKLSLSAAFIFSEGFNIVHMYMKCMDINCIIKQALIA